MRWLILGLTLLTAHPAQAARAKDVGFFIGQHENVLTGMGLVTGLPRTGDSMRNEASIRSLATRLQGYGVTFADADLASRNIALVMVEVVVPPGTRAGSRLDAKVSSVGDAASIEGGQLLIAPLYGMDGAIHATVSGSVLVGGYQTASAGNMARKNVPTSGQVLGGVRVAIEVPGVNYNDAPIVEFALQTPDFSTAQRLEESIDSAFGEEVAQAVSASTVQLTVPEAYQGRFAAFASMVESVDLQLDAPARIVVDERTGTVVIGGDVELAPVAIAQGSLTIEVSRINSVSQPAPFSAGSTALVSNVQLNVTERGGKLVNTKGASVGDLVNALNQMGVSPRDMVTILKNMKTQGAIHAEVVVQ